MTYDYHRQSLRESILKLGQNANRVTSTESTENLNFHDSLRQASSTRIAHLLRQLRAAHNISYAQIQTDTGLSQQMLFDVEYGSRRVTLGELKLLAECFDVSVSDILGVDIE